MLDPHPDEKPSVFSFLAEATRSVLNIYLYFIRVHNSKKLSHSITDPPPCGGDEHTSLFPIFVFSFMPEPPEVFVAENPNVSHTNVDHLVSVKISLALCDSSHADEILILIKIFTWALCSSLTT